MTISSFPTGAVQDDIPVKPTGPSVEDLLDNEDTTRFFNSAFAFIEKFIELSDDCKIEEGNILTESRRIIILDNRDEQKRIKYQLIVIYNKSHRLSTVRLVDDEAAVKGDEGESLEINRTFDNKDNALYGFNFSHDMLPRVIRDIRQVAIILSTAAGDRNGSGEVVEALDNNRIAISVHEK